MRLIEHGASREVSWQRAGLCVLLLLLLVRLVLMAWLPLTDTTEARYAEIARKMLETGNWVTPLHDYGVPFWAKPPLSTWLSALSMGVFGQTEFAVRLPSFALSLGVLWLIGSLVYNRHGREAALATLLMLSSSVLFFAFSGTVMTDSALLFCTTLILVAFWRSMTEPTRTWPYMFFVGVGLGLLAKGPIALVLAGMPVFFWVLIRHQWLALWQRLPWLKGCGLALLIAAPWYIWAEIRTPGFLEYFIVGEHIQRFLDSGWQGDKYGFAHATPRGMIWLFAFAALLPWSIAAPLWLWRARKHEKTPASQDGWGLFLVLWACMPLLFFTFSGNIIAPYVLPMLPAACLLFSEIWYRQGPKKSARLPWIAGFTLLLGVVATVLQAAIPERLLRTQKELINQWHALNPDADSQLIYWSSRREFSSEFYSAGRSLATKEGQLVQTLMTQPSYDFLVIKAKDLNEIPDALRQKLKELARVEVNGAAVLILGERASAQTQETTGKETPQ